MAFEDEGQGLDNTEASVEDQSYSPESNTETAPQGNPFWKEVEDKLGPNNYAVIQPYLAKTDAEYQKGITSANERLKSFQPYQPFIDEGISPEMIQQSVAFARQLDEAPEKIYESLGNFLRQNGRLPDPQELATEVQENTEEVDPRDAQLRQLQESQTQMQQFLQNQIVSAQQADMNRQADEWLDGEMKNLKETKGFADEDLKEIVRIAAVSANASGEIDLNKAVAHYEALQNRIRTAPRPGAFAPQVPGGVGGGTPGTGTVDPSKMTKAERIAAVAARLSQ